MPAFSRFGIWEEELLDFIKSYSALTKHSEAALTEWFKSDGMEIFVKEQGKFFHAYTSAYKTENGFLPTDITHEQMEEQKQVGFKALFKACKEKFPCNESSKSEADQLIEIFLYSALAKHKKLFKIQAAIVNSLNVCHNLNPNLSPDEINTFLNESFVSYKKCLPDFAQEIDAHIQLIAEYTLRQKANAATAQQTEIKPEQKNPDHVQDLAQGNAAKMTLGGIISTAAGARAAGTQNQAVDQTIESAKNAALYYESALRKR